MHLLRFFFSNGSNTQTHLYTYEIDHLVLLKTHYRMTNVAVDVGANESLPV